MMLTAAAAPGYWKGNDVAAGVHALVIGISDYPYLSGGSAPRNEHAPDSGGLGQLEISAISAARFFAWLRGMKGVAGAPVASCRLLLAPRPDEEAKVKELTDRHYRIADYEAIREELIAWGNELAEKGRGEGSNVALFFFSGHGVEVSGSPAILARDVLDQKMADGGANKAVAVDPMTVAIKTYNIDRGLFFIDACRDSPKVARLLSLTGDHPLRTNPNPLRRADALIRLHSTASGLRAYQVASDPATIFARAVLDGLDGPPPSYLPYDTSNVPWRLVFAALEGHTKRKVNELLVGHSPLALQHVEAYGNPYNAGMLVATKEAPMAPPVVSPGAQPEAAPPVSVPPERGAEPPALASIIESGSARVLAGTVSLTARHLEALRELGSAQQDGDLRDFTMMHEILGHETITGPWLNALQFLDARTGDPAPPEAARIVAARRQEIDSRAAAWIDLAVMPRSGGALWIGVNGLADEASTAVVIPQDLSFPIPVRLDVSFERTASGDWSISALSARLSDPELVEGDYAGAWAALWEAQRIEAFADLAAAARKLEETQLLERIVRDKRDWPVAAALAVTFLLRSNDLSYLHDWPRNLADWFPWLADGPVLWAETLLRRHDADQGLDPHVIGESYPAEALNYFVEIAKRGAPLLLTSLNFATRQAAFWRQQLENGAIPDEDRRRLEAAIVIAEHAGSYMASGGAFARFVADQAMSPELVLGVRQGSLVATAAGAAG